MFSRLLPRVVRSNLQVRNASMFCYQCEQTENSRSCVKVGNCGKTPSTAGLQDTLIHTLKGISMYTWPLLKENPSLHAQLKEQNRWMLEALFSTLTNVNFDDNRFFEYLDQAEANIKEAKGNYSSKHQDAMKGPATWKNDKNHKKVINDSRWFGIEVRRDGVDPDIFSLQELIVYGLKGLAAYAHHAMVLGKEDDQVYSFVYEVLSVLGKGEANADELLGYVLKLGEVNLRVMQLLSEGHESNFGVPTPSKVQLSPVPGKCILVSGHDLMDLSHLLEQTAGKGINVFTHGEMLPGHGYPELNKYPHLVGNYGDAWQAQRKDFSSFPGPILMTTNCLIQPTSNYAKRLFTRSAVGWPGVRHVKNYDFSEVIKCALECDGFEEADCPREHHHTMTGFGHKTVLSLADKIIEGVQKGQIGSFFVIGGCDGAKEERSYFRDMAHSVPKDGIVLTLGCGKYRFNKDFDKFGDIGGIPRLLDMGQCNDAYSAIQVAVALAEALKVPSVNHLPLHFGISWFEQKAVAVFCTMLHLGLRNIHLGPSLPAFVSPNVLKLLVEKYNITPAIGDGAEAAKKLAAAGNNL